MSEFRRCKETSWKVGIDAVATGDCLHIRRYVKSIRDKETQVSHNGIKELQIWKGKKLKWTCDFR